MDNKPLWIYFSAQLTVANYSFHWLWEDWQTCFYFDIGTFYVLFRLKPSYDYEVYLHFFVVFFYSNFDLFDHKILWLLYKDISFQFLFYLNWIIWAKEVFVEQKIVSFQLFIIIFEVDPFLMNLIPTRIFYVLEFLKLLKIVFSQCKKRNAFNMIFLKVVLYRGKFIQFLNIEWHKSFYLVWNFKYNSPLWKITFHR